MKRTLLSKRRKLNGSGLPLPKPVFCIKMECSSRLERFMNEWCKNIRGLWPDLNRVKVHDARTVIDPSE